MRARHGKRIVADKTAAYALNARSIDEVFPEGAAGILLTRSPGGVASSCARTFPRDFPSLEAGLQHWLRFYAALEGYAASLPPGTLYPLPYEDLLGGEHAVPPLCAYLGGGYEPRMLGYRAPG